MKPFEVSLLDLVSWGLALVAILVLAWLLGRFFVVRGLRSQLRKTIRHCVHCHLREEVAATDPKYGECHACGGVTTKGRSRKLG